MGSPLSGQKVCGCMGCGMINHPLFGMEQAISLLCSVLNVGLYSATLSTITTICIDIARTAALEWTRRKIMTLNVAIEHAKEKAAELRDRRETHETDLV